MPHSLEELKNLGEVVWEQFEHAKKSALQIMSFGADRWVTSLGFRLSK